MPEHPHWSKEYAEEYAIKQSVARRKALVQSFDYGVTLKTNDRLESAAFLAEKHGCSLQEVLMAQLAAALDGFEFP